MVSFYAHKFLGEVQFICFYFVACAFHVILNKISPITKSFRNSLPHVVKLNLHFLNKPAVCVLQSMNPGEMLASVHIKNIQSSIIHSIKK